MTAPAAEEPSLFSQLLGLGACLAFVLFSGSMLKDITVREIEAFHFDRAKKGTVVATITQRTAPRRRDAATVSYTYQVRVGLEKRPYHETQIVTSALFERLATAETVPVQYMLDAPHVVDLRPSKSALRWGSEGFFASWFLTLTLGLACALGLGGIIGYGRSWRRPAGAIAPPGDG